MNHQYLTDMQLPARYKVGPTDLDNDKALGRYQSMMLPSISVITQGSLCNIAGEYIGGNFFLRLFSTVILSPEARAVSWEM